MKRFNLVTAFSFVAVTAAVLIASSSTPVFAGATFANPADTAKEAGCNNNQQPTQISFGSKNSGQWYCVGKGNGGGGNNPGGGDGAGGGGGGPAPATVGPSTPADQAACNGLDQLGGTSCGQPGNPQNGQSAVASVAARIVNIISYIAGIAAVIMIVIAGVRYTTSGGDRDSVSSAKTALIYALVGIIVAALAQVIVHFVLNQTNI